MAVQRHKRSSSSDVLEISWLSIYCLPFDMTRVYLLFRYHYDRLLKATKAFEWSKAILALESNGAYGRFRTSCLQAADPDGDQREWSHQLLLGTYRHPQRKLRRSIILHPYLICVWLLQQPTLDPNIRRLVHRLSLQGRQILPVRSLDHNARTSMPAAFLRLEEGPRQNWES